jgi:hypothetical protein
MKFRNVAGLLILAFFVLVLPAAAQSRKAVTGAEVTGTFRNKAGSEFKILALGKGKLKIQFAGNYSYKMRNGEMMAHTGEANGEAAIEGDTAVFKPEDFEDTCTITLKFTKPGVLNVGQEGEYCGFGHNVTSSGVYRKVSANRPKFSDPL